MNVMVKLYYDKRLLTKNYGKRLLNALPIFPIEQPKMPEKQEKIMCSMDTNILANYILLGAHRALCIFRL
ncbi:hypothetical protein MASR2M36_38740 [Providencia sp.]